MRSINLEKGFGPGAASAWQGDVSPHPEHLPGKALRSHRSYLRDNATATFSPQGLSALLSWLNAKAPGRSKKRRGVRKRWGSTILGQCLPLLSSHLCASPEQPGAPVLWAPPAQSFPRQMCWANSSGVSCRDWGEGRDG